MKLADNASRGYAMAALLVALSVMSILLSVAMPTWSQMIRREREEELIFRGNQYARALSRYQRTRPGAAPTSLDELIKERLLRKKFRDPMAVDKEGEFQLLYLNQQGTAGRGAGPQIGNTLSTKPSGGIRGVASKNTGQSIRVFNGKTRYNEWEFVGMETSSQPGGGAGGRGGRGAGARGDGRGGRGSDPRGGPVRGDGRGFNMTPEDRGNAIRVPPPPR
jgi:type II secretory pathway pseudopilin PulG